MVIAVVVVVAVSQESRREKTTACPQATTGVPNSDSAAAELTAATRPRHVIYSLARYGYDEALSRWVAETIPQVIAPGTWDRTGVLRYFGPKKILVIYHTRDVHEQVADFLAAITKEAFPAGIPSKPTWEEAGTKEATPDSVARTDNPIEIPTKKGKPKKR
jgi:hypothetical protein